MKKVFSKKFSTFIVASMMFSVTTQAQWGLNGTNIFNSNSGNVGVGTNTPLAKFHVDNGASTTAAVRLNGTDVRMIMNNTTFQTFSSGNLLSINAKVASLNPLDVPGNLILQTNTNAIQSLKAGNVGIGTLNPLHKLHVNGASILAYNTFIYPRLHASSVVAGLIRDTSTWTVVSGVGGRNANTGTAWAIGSSASDLQIGFSNGTNDNSLQTAIQVSATRNVLLNPVSGNTGIGTLSPIYKLDVSGNGSYAGRIINTGNSNGLFVKGMTTANNGYGVLAYGGYIGMYGLANLAGAGSRVGVYGYANGGTTANYGIYGSAPANAAGTNSNWAVYASGSMYATSGYFSSDAKLKKDVTTFENAMDKINQLQPRSYTFKTDEYKYMNLPSEKQYGFIAQELEMVFPEMVRKVVQPIDVDNKEKGNLEFKAINYTELIPVLTKAIQEQNAVIAELKERLDNMEKANQSNIAKNGKPQTEGVATETTLYQNAPNPFNENTTIRYNVPMTCRQAAIKVMSMEGRELQTIPVTQKGAGQVVMSANSLASGNYFYQLVVDGKMSATKKMILVKQ